jgi:ElaB/YqjD/DUF883 family membrane-anchored ribosome-binding protein
MDRDMSGGASGASGEVNVPGTGEVRARVNTNPTEVDVRASASKDTQRDLESTADNLRHRAENAAENVRERASDFADEARQRASELGDRASHLVDDAQERLEGTGILNVVRDHPLPALGVAFGVGFMLAGSGDKPKSRTGRVARSAKKQLRTALLGGLGTVAMQEMQGMLDGIMGGGDRSGGRSRGRAMGANDDLEFERETRRHEMGRGRGQTRSGGYGSRSQFGDY